MPTLQPQKLSGLLVIPTVEFDTSINVWRVSIAVDTGFSRAGGSAQATIVERGDLVVELKSPTEGSLEPIASPDPGPLPVRALRVIQARGEFTFSAGNTQPTELSVALSNDRKTFPMTPPFATVPGCLKREPRERGPLPLSTTGLSLLQRLPKLWAFRGPSCCVRRFEAPLNVTTDATVKSEHFEIEGDFTAGNGRCRCGCCEYRQFVRGTFTDAAGAAVRFDMPTGPLSSTRYCEDGAILEFGPGKHGRYGNHNTSSPGDEYTSGSGHEGCTYRGDETAMCPATEGAHLEYIGLIVDRCKRTVVAKHEWVVDL